MGRFDGRVVVVTGGASGIGAACARRFAGEGAYVAVADIDTDRAGTVTESIAADGGSAIAVGCDVSSPDDWRRLAETVHANYGPVYVVHNNAFTADLAPAHELAEASWDRQLAVNLSGVYHSIRAFLPDLRQAGGCVVNTASVHAVVGLVNHPAYAAAKGGMVALTRQLAVEYGPNVRVNTVLPGPILTPIWDGIGERDRRETLEQTAALRLGRPEEVAAAVAFLASDEASYITGTALLVDGGYTAKRAGR